MRSRKSKNLKKFILPLTFAAGLACIPLGSKVMSYFKKPEATALFSAHTPRHQSVVSAASRPHHAGKKVSKSRKHASHKGSRKVAHSRHHAKHRAHSH